jgi:hypothetical protein
MLEPDTDLSDLTDLPNPAVDPSETSSVDVTGAADGDASEATAPGPLQWLISEAARPDAHITEALHLTYNADLNFFETHALGSLRAAGAAVTVVADSTAFRPDPRGMLRAGLDYTLGLAANAGAFHPKVNVLVGADRSSFSVGSGNLSYGGWLGNDELAAFFTADETQTPDVFWQLADILDATATVPLGPSAVAGIVRTANALRSFLNNRIATPTHATLVSSLGGPIIDQLPDTACETLAVYAPFHDLSAAAIDQLLRRLRPNKVILGVQQHTTVLAPDRLAQTLRNSAVDYEVRSLAENPYRHGKLIEVTSPSGDTWTLSGSANLSRAALLSGRPTGNVEIGVVLRGGLSLMPGGPVIDLDAIVAAAPDERVSGAKERGAQLLEARLDDDDVVLVLDRPAPTQLGVQVSIKDPEVYDDLVTFTVGQTTMRVPAPEALRAVGIARFRLVQYGTDGTTPGPAVPLLDPVLAQARIVRGSRGSQPVYTPTTLFSDPRIAEQWEKQLSALLSSDTTGALRGQRLPPAAGRASGAGSVLTFDDHDTWSRYYARQVDRLGDELVDLALGVLPQLSDDQAPRPAPTQRPEWADAADDEILLDEQDADVADIVFDVQLAARRTDHERSRYRSWLHRLSAGSAEAPLLDRMTRVALILTGTTLDLWDSPLGDKGWFDLLAESTLHLSTAEPGAHPPQVRAGLGSLAAACLYRLDQGLPARRAAREHTTFAAAASAVAPLLTYATAEGLDVRSRSLAPGDHNATAEYITDFIGRLDSDDTLAQNLRLLEREHPDWSVATPERGPRTGPLVEVVVSGTFSDPALAAAETLDLIAKSIGTEVPQAVTAYGRRAAIRLVRHRDLLSEARHADGHTRYITFDLRGGNAMGVRPGQERRTRTRLRPLAAQPTPQAQALCEEFNTTCAPPTDDPTT